MTTNRLVALLTPVAAVAAGTAADWSAKHFPGVEVSAAALEEIFIAGIVAVVAPAAIWMLGWQKHEAREAEADVRAEALDARELELELAAATPPAHGAVALDPPLYATGALDQPMADEAIELDGFELEDDVDEDELEDEDIEDEDFLAALADPASPERVG